MRRFFAQHAFNVSCGPSYKGEDALPRDVPSNPAARVIAYYLPQFHAVPENDLWWGAGFTEWTNVTKSVPRYAGHLQPRLPADLGFYDLTSADVLRRQATLARRAGIHGFCIHNYWFGGRRILETPLHNLLAAPDIDLPFCLNWANENWTRRWDGQEHDVLLEQRYDPADPVAYLRDMLPALRDPRYIRIEGRPLVMVYRPGAIPNIVGMSRAWRNYLKAEGLGDPYLVVPQVFGAQDPRDFGFDAASGFPPHNSNWFDVNDRDRMRLFDSGFQGHVRSYTSVRDSMLAHAGDGFVLHPGVMPGWDNEARKPGRGAGFYGADPHLYGGWLAEAVARAAREPAPDARLVFVNAWNEWAEGAILEPDRHFGFAFLAETRRVLDAVATGEAPRQGIAAPINPRAHPLAAGPRVANLIVNKARKARRRLRWR